MKRVCCLLVAVLFLFVAALPAFAEFDAGSTPNRFCASSMIRLLLYNGISDDVTTAFTDGTFPVSDVALNHLYTSDMTVGDMITSFYADGYYWFQGSNSVEVYAGGVKLISDGSAHLVNFASDDIIGIKFLSNVSAVPYLYYGFAYSGQDVAGIPRFEDTGYADTVYSYGDLPIPDLPDEPNPPIENAYSMFQYADISVTMSDWSGPTGDLPYPDETFAVTSSDYLINGITFERFSYLAYYSDNSEITAGRATIVMDFSEHRFDYRSTPFYFHGTGLLDGINIYYRLRDGTLKTTVARDVMVTGYTGGQRRMFALPVDFSGTCYVERVEFYIGQPIDYMQECDFFVGTNDYNAGYADGFSVASSVAYEQGHRAGFDEGNQFGYNRGYTAGQNADNTFYELIFAVVDAPVGVLRQMFNFNILGVNMSLFIFSLFTVLAVIVIVKKVK